jgi:hypothetical protein
MKPFTVLILIAVIILGDIISGAIGISSPVAPPVVTCSTISGGKCEQTLFENGNVTITVPLNAGFASVLVNFTKPFLVPPNMTISLANDPWTGTGAIGLSTDYVVNAPGNRTTQWKNMPAATTELFGITGSTIGVFQGGFCPFACLQGSTMGTGLNVYVTVVGSVNAVLEVQYSQAPTGPWTDPCGGTADVHINTLGFHQGNFCQTGGINDQFLRVVGKNGNGVASPQFGMIDVQTSLTLDKVAQISLCNDASKTTCTLTTTQASVFAELPILNAGNASPVFIVNWVAQECIVVDPNTGRPLSAC